MENLAKTYSNIAHCYNKRKKYQESIEASFRAIQAKPDFHRPYLRVTTVCWSRGRRWRGTMV